MSRQPSTHPRTMPKKPVKSSAPKRGGFAAALSTYSALHLHIRDTILAALVVCEDVAAKFAKADDSGHDALARVAVIGLRQILEDCSDSPCILPHARDAAHALVTLLRGAELATAQPLLDHADSWLDLLCFEESGSELARLRKEQDEAVCRMKASFELTGKATA